jgi:cytoskeletal protein RodZ
MAAFLILVALCLYFIPSFVAKNNNKTNITAIFVLNLLLGWTIIGWVVALVWAVTKETHPVALKPKHQAVAEQKEKVAEASQRKEGAMFNSDGSTKKNWAVAICLIAVALLIFLGALLTKVAQEPPTQSAATRPTATALSSSTIQITKVSLSEAQCKDLLNQFYAFTTNKPFTRTQLAREILEQYFVDAGIPAEQDTPNVRYTLPDSKCGTALDGLLSVIAMAQKQ